MHLIVPDFFWVELTNVLWKAVRRGRCTRETAVAALAHCLRFSGARGGQISPRSEVQVVCCGAFEGGLVKLKLIIVIVALLTLGTAAETPAQSSEAPTAKKIDALFSRVTSSDAP